MKTNDFGKARNEILRSYNTSTASGTYVALGTPLESPARMVKWKNNTNVDVFISYNGVDDHDVILSQDREIEDLGSN